METETGDRFRNVLSRRYDVLESVREESKAKAELVAELDQSRSTIDRAITELLTIDCLEPTDTDRSRYRSTPTGTVALQTYQEYCSDTDFVQRCAPVLNALEPGTEISECFVSTAELHASSKTPDVALQPTIDLLEGATKLTGTAPVVFGEYFDILTEWMERGEAAMELVLEQELLESIVTNYSAEFTTLTGFGSVEFYVYDGEIPYALWLIDREPTDHAGITIYEQGGIKGSLVTDADPAVRWGRAQYDRLKAESTKLESHQS
ncbi:helix-turn-helix transcriptional regulator [Natronoglomus mannanivorans]|uniref:Uncharacterized protein n=1 Tax=Natronoglomus mannanivorans TaxID=2979990 RepID=A0AAP3E228_9EURY|nr:hypothetical protein [Halobacteria archaeon AArc-xg1-1]